MFLIATLVYRLANGLLFLAVAWNLVQSSSHGALALALSAIFGFFPAVAAAPLGRWLLERIEPRILTLFGIAGLSACALAFIPFLNTPDTLLAINVVLLTIFFLLEGVWDALLATAAKRLPTKSGERLNSRQSAATQAGLMLGGLPLGFLIRLGGTDAPFIAAAVLYTISASMFLFPALRMLTTGSEQRDTPATSSTERPGTRVLATSWRTLATLALVWPSLSLVNMVIPLVANTQGRGAVEQAAILDASIGLGMAFAGVMYEKLATLPPPSQKRAIAATAVFIPLPFAVLLTLTYRFPMLCATFFLCGIGFGALRVSMRKQLMATQPAHRVGQIVVSCNAFGFPVLALLALAYSQSWKLGPVIPMVVFLVFAGVGVMALYGEIRGGLAAEVVARP
nr:MFS transporter [Paraburkholderia sp. Tr-20389]